MDIRTFKANAKQEKGFSYMELNGKLYVQPDKSMKSFSLPKELESFRDVVIVEISPTGKKLLLSNLEIEYT